jgi:membrane associated rhomboid family serine protease
MAYYPRETRRRYSFGDDGNALIALISVELIAFVILAFIKVIYYFTYGQDGLIYYNANILHWVTLPASFKIFLTRPWTIITHFLVHDGVWHLVANMLWLWAFGYIMQDLTGNKRIVPIFLYGALAGALAFMIAFNVIPAFRPHVNNAEALGASAGVMAVAIGTTMLAPGYRLFPMINGGIPLWILTAIFAVIDLATIPYDNPGGHIAHLAGAAMGFFYVTQLKRGRDLGAWMERFHDWYVNLFNPDKPAKGKSVKNQLFYKANVAPFNKKSNVSQQRIDEILEKIHQKGYKSLTDDEKEILKRASE